MSQEQSDTVTVRDHTEQSRFEIMVDGEVAGFADYVAHPDLIDFTHTEIFESYAGRGLAKRLALQALDEVRSRGLSAVPHCSLFQGMIAKNPEYADLVPQDRRAEFDLG